MRENPLIKSILNYFIKLAQLIFTDHLLIFTLPNFPSDAPFRGQNL